MIPGSLPCLLALLAQLHLPHSLLSPSIAITQVVKECLQETYNARSRSNQAQHSMAHQARLTVFDADGKSHAKDVNVNKLESLIVRIRSAGVVSLNMLADLLISMECLTVTRRARMK